MLGPAGYCLVEPPALEQPAHLAATLDPVSGQGLVRITGEPGTAIDAPVVPVDGLDLGGQPAYEVFWTEASRQGYPLNPAWSTDQSLLKLSVFTDDEPRLRYDVFLDGSSYEPRVVTQLPPGGGFRWSEAPGASDRFYKFPWTRRQRDGQPDPTATAGDIVYEFVVDPDEPSVERVRSIHLPAQFDMHALGGKSSIAFVGGREVVALVGGVAVGMGQYDWFAYLFDLVTEEMVGAPFELTDPQCGLDDPQTCRMLYWNQLRFSPDGTHLLVAYDGGTTRPQRLLDVDPVHGVITPHALPEDDCTRCLGGDRSEGFMRASWGHQA